MSDLKHKLVVYAPIDEGVMPVHQKLYGCSGCSFVSEHADLACDHLDEEEITQRSEEMKLSAPKPEVKEAKHDYCNGYKWEDHVAGFAKTRNLTLEQAAKHPDCQPMFREMCKMAPKAVATRQYPQETKGIALPDETKILQAAEAKRADPDRAEIDKRFQEHLKRQQELLAKKQAALIEAATPKIELPMPVITTPVPEVPKSGSTEDRLKKHLAKVAAAKAAKAATPAAPAQEIRVM